VGDERNSKERRGPAGGNSQQTLYPSQVSKGLGATCSGMAGVGGRGRGAGYMMDKG
jgi:hypothetical protein